MEAREKLEAEGLPSSVVAPVTIPPKTSVSKWMKQFIPGIIVFSVALVYFSGLARAPQRSEAMVIEGVSNEELCPQAGALYPKDNGRLYFRLNNWYETEWFADKAAGWVS